MDSSRHRELGIPGSTIISRDWASPRVKQIPTFTFKVVGNLPLILVLYVDDLFLTGDEHQIAQCKRELSSEFEMKDLGLMHYFLGLEVWQRSDEIFLSQGKYTVDILRRFGMMDYKSMATPMVANLKKLHETTSCSDSVDSTMYR